MKTIKKINYLLISFLLLSLLNGCKKYLDKKPNQRLAVPTTLKDLRALLENSSIIFDNPSSDEVSSDNYYLTEADLNNFDYEGQRRMYVWAPDNIFDYQGNDWAKCYRKIYYCNVVLGGLERIASSTTDKIEWNILKGQALMIRGKTYLQAAIIWGLAFDERSANTDMGLPLRLNDDFTEKSERSSLAATYEQIIADLKMAIRLLPITGVNAAYATKAAGFAYLSRTYLSMRKYEAAGKYADSCLQLKNSLIDYNSLSATATFPFAALNNEQIYFGAAWMQNIDMSRAKIDSFLYQSYQTNDLRKTIFYKLNSNGSAAFKGSYVGGSTNLFAGIATNEMYLTRAECYARAGDKVNGLNDLNALLLKRFKTGTFVLINAADANSALQIILTERRKELVMNFTRWMDIKRLNKEGAGIVLKRIITNQSYMLLPNDLRYALPIPEDIIALSRMLQNPR